MSNQKMKTRRQYRPLNEHSPNRSWDAAHFPKGTVVHIERCTTTEHLAALNNGSYMFEVDSLFFNGARSFVIETTCPDDRKTFGDGARVSFNASWVVAIDRRGDGPVVINPGHRRSDPRDHYSRINLDEADLLSKLHAQTGRRYKKHYVFYTFERLKFLNIVRSVVGEFQGRLDVNLLVVHALRTHPEWVNNRYEFLEHWVVPKADLHRWIKQNARRFLRSLDAVQAQEREIEEQEYRRAVEEESKYWNRVYEDENGDDAECGCEGDGIGDDPGSCYDPVPDDWPLVDGDEGCAKDETFALKA